MVDELDEDVLDVVDVVIKDAIDIVVEGILDDVVELEVVEDVMGAVNNGIYEVEDNGDVEVIVACVKGELKAKIKYFFSYSLDPVY